MAIATIIAASAPGSCPPEPLPEQPELHCGERAWVLHPKVDLYPKLLL
ncbi:MAG: hypothetical protein ACYCO3_12300 [Mycobacteriales bacterium]